MAQRPTRLSVLLAAAVTLALAACGSSTDDASPAETPAPVESEAPAESVVETTDDHEHDENGEDVTDASESVGDIAGAGIDLDSFFDGALVGDPTTIDCTLASGADTTCYELTIPGFPTTRSEIGPFCPSTTSDTAADVGIWFDGEGLYDIDGEFIMGLPEIYDDPYWNLVDEDGTVRVTDYADEFVAVIEAAFSTGDVDPELENICIQGEIAWLEGGEPVEVTVEIPTTPTLAASPTAVGTTLGITLDGVRIENSAPVDLILSTYTIAAFDDCGGHVNPVDGYHMHATTGCSDSDATVPDGETAMFAYALDGFAIHGPLDVDAEAAAGLDECNGHETEELGFHYHANQVVENAVLVCFSGETTDAATAGGPGGGPPPDGGPPPGDG